MYFHAKNPVINDYIIQISIGAGEFIGHMGYFSVIYNHTKQGHILMAQTSGRMNSNIIIFQYPFWSFTRQTYLRSQFHVRV